MTTKNTAKRGPMKQAHKSKPNARFRQRRGIYTSGRKNARQ
jgi:hypothetical protein